MKNPIFKPSSMSTISGQIQINLLFSSMIELTDNLYALTYEHN